MAMKLVTFSRDGRGPRLGAVLGPWDRWERVVDLNAADERIPADMLALVDVCGGLSGEVWGHVERAADRALQGSGRDLQKAVFPMEDIVLRAPIAPRLLRDFIAFRGHIARTRANAGSQVPAEWDRLPAYYNGDHLNVVGPGDSVAVPRFVTFDGGARNLVESAKLDYETEIGFVLGKGGQTIPAEDAWEHLFGVTIFNDFSARDLQSLASKVGMGPPPGKDWANSLGPCIVTRDEFGSLEGKGIAVRVNGSERLRGDYRRLVYESPFVKPGERAAWTFPEIVEALSRSQAIHAGEVWGSGTIPGGCEFEKGEKAAYLRPGDVVELEVEGIGVLRNAIVAAR